MKFFFRSKKPLSETLTLTNEEQILLASLDFDEGLATTIKNKTQNNLEELLELQVFDEYKNGPKLRGIKSLVDKKVSVPEMLQIVKDYQSDNRFRGYHIFSCGHSNFNRDHFIVAMKTLDKYECLRTFETNGLNSNLGTNDIIGFLKKWETQSKFSIIEADYDYVTIQLKDFNFDIDAFCKEALIFCPDFSAAVENEKELKAYIINRKGEVDFWWD